MSNRGSYAVGHADTVSRLCIELLNEMSLLYMDAAVDDDIRYALSDAADKVESALDEAFDDARSKIEIVDNYYHDGHAEGLIEASLTALDRLKNERNSEYYIQRVEDIQEQIRKLQRSVYIAECLDVDPRPFEDKYIKQLEEARAEARAEKERREQEAKEKAQKEVEG